MVLPADPKAGLVLIGTSTGAATFRGFLRRLYPANAAPTAGRGPIVVILGGATREAIPYVEEFEQAQERLGPGRFRLELALGGARVDDGSETTLPDKIKGLSLIAKEIMDRGGRQPSFTDAEACLAGICGRDGRMPRGHHVTYEERQHGGHVLSLQGDRRPDAGAGEVVVPHDVIHASHEGQSLSPDQNGRDHMAGDALDLTPRCTWAGNEPNEGPA